MSKRVAGGLLSFLLAFSLLLPLAGAEGDARQGAEEGKGAVSKLNPAAPEVLDAVKAKELRLQSKKGPAGAKSAKPRCSALDCSWSGRTPPRIPPRWNRKALCLYRMARSGFP
ncbi:hypothetical protein HMSSN036_18320 [Paenibacillus macerans]|nr:hypothetical protein HMSSN036_18320 [Paenibacillus macerans]